MSIQALVDSMLDEADLIDDLLDVVTEQRDAVKDGDYQLTQLIMKDVQDISFQIQAEENQRAGLAEALSKELGCAANLSAIAAAIPENERALFVGAGERLGHSVFELKSEIAILKGLIEHNERFSAMLLSEWRRLDADFTYSGGLDFRG